VKKNKQTNNIYIKKSNYNASFSILEKKKKSEFWLVFRFFYMANDNEPNTFKEALERYIEYRTRFERLENDFDEYQQSSLNYEQELEVQLKQLDSQTHRLQQELFVERTQNEQYRERSEQTIKQFDKRLDQVQEELNACKNLNEKLTTYIRELEQTNDDLERSMIIINNLFH
jgi:chromosome segregation ATPase